MFNSKTSTTTNSNSNNEQMDNINNGLFDINLNQMAVQKSIQQSEIIVVDSLFSMYGN